MHYIAVMFLIMFLFHFFHNFLKHLSGEYYFHYYSSRMLQLTMFMPVTLLKENITASRNDAVELGKKKY